MKRVVLLSIPGLRARDLANLPVLAKCMAQGEQATLVPSCPAVTWPVQANMLTGVLPARHGVVANGFYWRDTRQVEMWTAWNDKILAPQIWDRLHEHDQGLSSAAWFPMLSKGCGADFVCMPAPVHNPDGSESLWCYTKPTELYGELRDRLGHFPLQHFWGPLANIKSTAWIVDSAVLAAQQFRPRFSYLYLPHLDYAAQKTGPDSPAALAAVGELDGVIHRLVEGIEAAFAGDDVLWLAAGEYAIVPVSHATFPNRLLRVAGLLQIREADGGEQLDVDRSAAWTLVDHQVGHVFVRNRDPDVVRQVVEIFRTQSGIAEVLSGDERGKYSLDHERSGDVLLISTPESWQAYYWWLDDGRAPSFARTVDIHRKPGYDPVELHFDFATRSIPLDATLIRGSHGAPAVHAAQKTVLLASQPVLNRQTEFRDIDVCGLVLKQLR
jgi:predicted AlkP superfamily pyrophosphatase or phosphodiesterase